MRESKIKTQLYFKSEILILSMLSVWAAVERLPSRTLSLSLQISRGDYQSRYCITVWCDCALLPIRWFSINPFYFCSDILAPHALESEVKEDATCNLALLYIRGHQHFTFTFTFDIRSHILVWYDLKASWSCSITHTHSHGNHLHNSPFCKLMDLKSLLFLCECFSYQFEKMRIKGVLYGSLSILTVS